MSVSVIRRPAVTLGEDFGPQLHPVLRRVYAARGLINADLDLSLHRLLPVCSLEGVEAAARLLLAHRSGGRVLVIGDFDADGATSTAVVVRALRALRFAHVDFLVPDRFRFGYGLTPQIVAVAATRNPTLLVTVDNGVSSVEGVEAAHARGIPVLVTDHHLPGAQLPRADQMVNPNLLGSRFASPALAGVGVAFYVIAALAKALPEEDFKPQDLLDLVALGTVADVVALDFNNRVLVDQGLRRIRAGRCVPGIRALLEASGRAQDRTSAADLGFAVAPRLNAAGRLSDMSVGIACLLADVPATAAQLAGELSRLNAERRDIEARMQSEALEIAGAARFMQSGDESPGLCLFDETWHQGVIGLVAGRIKERLHRPIVAFARAEDGSLRGSARSIAGVNIRDALGSIAVRHPGLIERFGGHAMAAGLSLAEGRLAQFTAAFAAEIASRADAASLAGVLHSDGELSEAELCVDTARVLRAAGPWGQGFSEPLFDGEFVVSSARILAEKHLKLTVRAAGPRGGDSIDAIAFGYVGTAADSGAVRPGARVQLAYRLEVNEYNGTERMQLNCQHVNCLQ